METITAAALTDLRIVEISRDDSRAIPYGSRLLADLGADVVLVEPPAGHPLRRSASGTPDDDDLASAVFAYLASGKKSVVVDHSSTGNALGALLDTADVIVTDLTPDELGACIGGELGDSKHRVAVYVTPWGLDGPYAGLPASGLVLQAAAGWVSNRMDPTSKVVQVGGRIHEWVAGSYIAAAILTARASVRRNGTNVDVDFSMFECLHSTLPYPRLMADTNAELGGPATPSMMTPFGVRRCLDGWVGINILTGQQWVDACLLTELDDFAGSQQEFNLGTGDLEAFQLRLLEWLSERTVNEVVELGQSLRIPVVPVATGATLAELSQWQERQWFEPLGDARGLQRPGPPWRLSRTPANTQRPAPAVNDAAALIGDLANSEGTR